MRSILFTAPIFFLFTVLTFNVHANDLIFKCKFENSKQVSLYKNENDITYSFGKIGSKPDLKLKRKKDQLSLDLGNLSGRYITNSIKIKNGIYSYQLTTSVDRIADEQIPSTSLTVMKNDKSLTTIQCIKDSEEGSLISIDD